MPEVSGGGAKWTSPVGDPNRVDIIVGRKDDTVRLYLVLARPLKTEADVRVLLEKFTNYCRYVESTAFAEEFGKPSRQRVMIPVRTDWELDPGLIESLERIAAENQTPAQIAVFYEDPA